MFSESYYGEIKQYFHGQMALLNDRREELRRKETELPDAEGNLPYFCRELLEQKIEEIEDTLKRCTGDEAEALQFLYSAMPLSDMLDYPAAVYLAYARHGVFLWQEGPFAGKVPERIFANYVLHYRIHNEDIADNRRFFYDRLKGEIEGKSMYDATLAANLWCAGKATYRTTFMRTQNPLTMYGTGIGRCGEGAPFASTAFRSIGIPARQVATPWWAHCDDNHAWVEAWCDGKWHFLGGGEAENRLDKAWFKGPAARAMMINSRWFGKDRPLEPVAGRPDMSAKVNQLGLYADTCQLRVKVLDSKGNPVPGARVDFCLLNYGRFGSMATLVTGQEPGNDDYGTVEVETGYGDLLVCAYGNGMYGEEHVSLAKVFQEREGQETVQGGSSDSKGSCPPVAECAVVLDGAMRGLDAWRDVDMCAPREVPQDEEDGDGDSEEDKKRSEAAAESRRRRTEAFYRREAAERALMRFSGEDREELDQILHQARGNINEIVRFLEWDFAGRTVELVRHYGQEKWKLEALKTLRENDYWDLKAEVLAECCAAASPYAGKLPREVFFSCLLCPSVMYERPRACREALAAALGEEEKSRILQNPECLPGMVNGLVISLPKQEYGNLITSPLGCLTGGLGNGISKVVLCVQIYRTLGIPARVRPMDRTMEYYANGEFRPVATGEEKESQKVPGTAGGQGAAETREPERTGTLILESGKNLKTDDWQHYSLSRFEEGRFNPLFIRAGMKKKNAAGEDDAKKDSKEGDPDNGNQDDGSLELELAQGIYRLVTTNRLPNGNQLAGVYDFELKENQVKRVELVLREISREDLLDQRPVEELVLYRPGGEELGLLDLNGAGQSLLLWLELTKEPTEHILNEMCERKESFRALKTPIYFVVREGADYEADGTLKKVREALPEAKVLVDEFGVSYVEFSRQAGCNPGKLPLAAVLEGGRECVYSAAGYNVGMADLLLRILE